MKLFDRWDVEGIEPEDPGLKDHINLEPMLAPKKSHGRHAADRFTKSEVNLVERLMNHLMGPGHRGKKHKVSSGNCGGKSRKVWDITKETFSIIKEREDENPLRVLLGAVENTAPVEEVSSYQVGSIIKRKAVITSPQRRIDISLRHIAQGAYSNSVGSEKEMAECLAEEILAAYNKERESYAFRQKERLEREAEGAR
ncbi:MAG: 30S ribosomal protein S7 [Candidatus Aenigmatarchaeota archaeon]